MFSDWHPVKDEIHKVILIHLILLDQFYFYCGKSTPHFHRHLNYQFSLFYFSLTGGGGGTGSEKAAVLEQKLYKLQEELTELHRQKGEVCICVFFIRIEH